MIRIFFKTIWNQRSKNILIFLEFLLIYLVISNLSIYYTNMISIKLIPNCYHHDNVVKISIRSKGEDDGSNHNGAHLSKLKLSLGLNEYTECVSVSTRATPFNYNLATSGFDYGDEEFDVATRNVDIEYRDVMKIETIRGRWFNDTDRGKKVQPAIIDILTENETFDGDAMGKRFGEESYEVVGIVNAFKRSDIEKPYNSMFRFWEPNDTVRYSSVDYLVRIKPGHLNDFLNIANREIFNVLDNRFWVVSTLNTLENQQEEQNANSRIKRLITLLIVIFVIINIILGVIGILWYNTNLRIHEIGIKRAMGSYGRRITRQIITENVILALAGAVPVIILLAQAEGLRIAPLKGDLFLLSQIIAFFAVILLVLLCSWLPARLASSIQPATALKYE